ncbi:MAG: hypothetical protein ABSH03_16175 [Candidatus Lustribacter sp.]|jgi:hypothetical protein
MKDYSSGDLMAAILSLQDATAGGFAKADALLGSMETKITDLDKKLDSKIDGLRQAMNRRFDSVDERFDWLARRVEAIESRGDRPAL